MKLTKEETKWVRRMQKALDECPSERLGFYTSGDPTVSIYDKSKEPLFGYDGETEFAQLVAKNDAHLAILRFPSSVDAVAA